MLEPYREFSEVYDKCNVSDFSAIFGKSLLTYFKEKHPNDTFKTNLDICCGTGVLCNYFKSQNISSKGIDISEGMIKKAKENFPEIDFICEDASNYKDTVKYDFITCTDDAINHITDKNILKRIFNNIHESLRDGGFFVFDINDFEPIVNKNLMKSIDDNHILKYNVKETKEGLISVHVMYYENDELKFTTDVFEKDYPIEEIKKLLNETGFEIEICSKDFYDSKEIHKWKIVSRACP